MTRSDIIKGIVIPAIEKLQQICLAHDVSMFVWAVLGVNEQGALVQHSAWTATASEAERQDIRRVVKAVIGKELDNKMKICDSCEGVEVN